MEDLPRNGNTRRLPARRTAPFDAFAISRWKRASRETSPKSRLGLSEKDARDEARRCLKLRLQGTLFLRSPQGSYRPRHRLQGETVPRAAVYPRSSMTIRSSCATTTSAYRADAVSQRAPKSRDRTFFPIYLKHGRQLVGTKSGLPLQETDCVSCGQCVNACPCGALRGSKRER